MVIIFFINFILLYLLLIDRNKKAGSSVYLRKSFLQAMVFTTLAVFLITESLSFFNLITRTAFILTYTIIFAVLLVLIILKIRNKNFFFPRPFLLIKSLDRQTKITISLVVLFIILPLLFIAIYFPPNTADSMTYHLSRVEHWIQNQNVEYYPTNNFRQLYYQPLAEYIILHIRLISGNDYFVRLVQFISMLGTVVVATLLARLFDLRRKGQLLAAVIVICTPMGVTQSTSTQNDYLLTFLFLTFIYYSIKIMWRNPPSFGTITFTGITLGLALLTKGTAYMFVLPILLWLGINQVIKHRLKAIKLIVILFFISILINSFYYTRNIKISSRPFGDKETTSLVFNTDKSPRGVFSIAIRNIGVQMGLPIPYYNKFIDNIVYGVHKILNIDINNRQSTVKLDLGHKTDYHTLFVPTDEQSGNFSVLLALFLSLVLLLANYSKYKHKSKFPIYYILSLLLGFILFSFILKWQPWQSRLLLPITIGFSVFIAYVFTTALKANAKIINIVMLAFAVFAIPFLVGNYRKSPLLIPFSNKTRIENYFNAAPEYFIDYKNIADELNEKKINNIGLAHYWEDIEYPWWIMLNANANSNIKIKYYDFPEFLKNTKNYDDNFKFEAIITSYVDIDQLIADQEVKNISESGVLKLIIVGKYKQSSTK